MAVITNREIAEECRYPTIDLVAVLRARSLRWAGRELRKAPEESLVHQMLVAVAEHEHECTTCNSYWAIGHQERIYTHGCSHI
jgi:hypothetical protein